MTMPFYVTAFVLVGGGIFILAGIFVLKQRNKNLERWRTESLLGTKFLYWYSLLLGIIGIFAGTLVIIVTVIVVYGQITGRI